ncbi:MAG: M20 family metallopeptidase [Thermoanaerobaculia bacterium]
MVSERAKRVLSFLQADRGTMFRFLESLVRAESPSQIPDSQVGVQGLMADELEDLGFRVRRIPGTKTGGHLFAVPRGRPRGVPVQLMLGHSDTVWPLGTIESMPVTIRSGRMTGPGIYDMKAGLALMICAVRALQECRLEPEVTPVVFINSDEEIGSHESKAILTRLAKMANRVLVLEPPMGPDGRLKTVRKGVGQFTIRVRGKAAHAGLEPEEGASAILELSRVVQKLFALNDADRGITVNVGTIDGGIRPNVVAPESTAVADVRVMSMDQAREIEETFHSLRAETPGTKIEVEGGVGTPPLEGTPRNRVLWEVAREAGRELGLELEECLAGGGSDGNLTSLHAPTLDGLGAVGGGAHAAHEFIEMDRMIERGALVALLLAAPPLDLGG